MIEVNYNEYKETIADNMQLIQENHKLKEEIERLNNELKLYKDNHEHLNNLLQQKDNIIKEAREYIGNYNLEYLHETNEHNLANILEELLEILDKEKV